MTERALLTDLRRSARSLRRAPALVAAVVVTLALGIGANTAIFSIVRALLLDPLPYRDADRLVFVWSDLTQAGYPRAPLAAPELRDLRERTVSFSGLGAIWATTAALTGDRDPEQVRIGLVTLDFFDVLGADASLGRTFRADDQTEQAPESIVLSWDLWQRRYGGDPAIVGRRIRVNELPTTVLGVMPRGFRLWLPADANVPDDLQAWQPFPRAFLNLARGQQFLRVVGRMRPGARLEQASEDVARVGREVGQEFTHYAETPPHWYAVDLHADGVRDVRPAVVALFAGVTLLLAIACVNVAGLSIARSVAKRREYAMQQALGASQWQIARQPVCETLLLAALGGVAGVAVASAGVRLLIALRPEGLTRIATAGIDSGVLIFTASVTLGCAFLVSASSLAALLRSGGASLGAALHGSDRTVAGGGTGQRLRRWLVVTQIAIAFVLLVSSGLLVRGFVRLQQVDLGFDPAGALTFRVGLPPARYSSPERANEFSRRLLDELGRLPSVTAAGGVSHLPYDNLPNWSTPYAAEGFAEASQVREADARAVTPGYFEAIGAVLVDGRAFTNADEADRLPVAIVDERLAARTWPGARAVGKRMLADPRATGTMETLVTVVGVVRHMRHRTPEAEVREQIYFPQRQVLRNPLAYVIRTAADPAGLAAPAARILVALDPSIPAADVRPLSAYIERAHGRRRYVMQLAAAFAGVAVLLAWVGVYGVIAHSVVRHRREFAIRRALGAQRSAIVRLVLRDAARLGVWGLGTGLFGAIAAAFAIRHQLFGVEAHDPITFSVAMPTVLAAVLAASLAPALGAIRGGIPEALRME